jgi:para-nitrobenzyl esterase
MKIFVVLLALVTALCATAADPGPIAAVSGGQIQGALLDGGGAVFKGIPYAEPPVGDLRWREPRPVKPWNGVREATGIGPLCAQKPSFIVPNAAEAAKEDCLYLNVWTAHWPSQSRLPVMVWIPGGGNFAGGSSDVLSDGERLARHDVIVVTLNYRLGTLGFFSHPALTRESAHHASGNQGILDQIAALEWVRDNIAAFGGDPQNVTIFGESAGSLDVSVLMTSPLSKGLFQRAIGESGAVILVGEPQSLAEAEQRGVALAEAFKIPPGAGLDALRAVPAAAISAAEPNYFAKAPQNLFITVDGYVFPKKPAEVFALGQEHRVGMLLGSNSHETVPGSTLPTALKEAIAEAYGPLAERAQTLYGATPDPLYGTPEQQWATDTSFRCSAVAQLMWHVGAKNPSFQYEFARVPAGREAVGATHAVDLSYVFGTLDSVGIIGVGGPPVKPTDVDFQVSALMQQYWTNFAKTGDPNGSALPAWPRFDATSRAYLQFTERGAAAKEGLRRPYCDLFMENVKRLDAP